jgi:hypothetical protein
MGLKELQEEAAGAWFHIYHFDPEAKEHLLCWNNSHSWGARACQRA